MKAAAPVLLAILLAACDGQSGSRTSGNITFDLDDLPDQSAAPVNPAAEADNPCQRQRFENVWLTHCTADPRAHRIRTALRSDDGKPYRGLGRFAGDSAQNSTDIAFAVNGGMFDDEGQPIGYYVENGKRLRTINVNQGPGNFHMLPNGVFFGDKSKWQVRSAKDFIRNVRERPRFGTQSGPMLVIDGKLHPKITEDGDSRYIRNAVGVDQEGHAHFVISDGPLSLGKLARFYRDELKVPNALYLDGNVSALWNPAGGRMDTSPPLGPLIVVEKRAKAVGHDDNRAADSGNAPETADNKAETDA